MIEISHRVSKTASNAFWKLAHKWFHRLFTAKKQQLLKKKVPQFAHLRRKMYAALPKIHLEIGYVHKETGELTVIHTSVTPRSKFPPDKYQKVYEIASVNVSYTNSLLY